MPVATSSELVEISWVLLVVLASTSVVLFVLLVVTRAVRDVWERRNLRRREEVRHHILDLVLGEDDDAARARAVLGATSGRERQQVQDQILSMLPKLRGESRTILVDLLLDQGAERRAVALTRSRSSVRRCRGAFQLGVLGLTEHLEVLVGLLGDPAFLVRRVAVRALGNMGDPRAVRPLLVLGEHDQRLTRDLTYALDRLGPAAAPELRSVLAEQVRVGGEHQHLEPAAVVLGLLGDRGSVEVLSDGLGAEDPVFAQACAEALGRIGAPESIPVLVEALLDLRPNVRAAAAQALGSIGSSVAADSLADVVAEDEPQVSRPAAEALLQLTAGRALLEASGSAYAREALALEAIRGARR